jgi:spectinomycin phosphotransferase
MLERPELHDRMIVAALDEGYGLRARELDFLPIGNDAASWAFAVHTTAGERYFLKLRAGPDGARGVVVPHQLHRLGVPHVLAPLTTLSGVPWLEVERFVLALYPMVEGGTGASVGMSPGDWRTLGAVARRIHDTALGPELIGIVGRESFRPSWRRVVEDLPTLVERSPGTDPVKLAFAAAWRKHQDRIRAVAGHADALGLLLERSSLPHVLCHGDLHAWNILLDDERGLLVVDWVEAVLAPLERDLMFVVGGIGSDLVNPSETQWFFEGYGEAVIDQRALAYYRCAWAVQDIGSYAGCIFQMPSASDATRRAALDGFASTLAPRAIVDIALSSEAFS